MSCNKQALMKNLSAPYLRNIPNFKTGDTVRVFIQIEEGNKKRIQIFEGLVISRKGGNDINGNFTVRKVYSGVEVERIFPLHSPLYEKIEVLRYGKIKRAKLYYVRHLSAKAIRIKEKK